MNTSDLIKGESYAFSPVAAALWPNYTGVKYSGSVSYEIASKMESVATRHAAALAYLPSGTTTKVTNLTFLLFTTGTTTIVMAEEWINWSTMRRVSTGVMTIQLANVSASQSSKVTAALAAAGFTVTSITT